MICSSVNFDRFIVRSFKMGRTLASDGGVIWGHSTSANGQNADISNVWGRHVERREFGERTGGFEPQNFSSGPSGRYKYRPDVPSADVSFRDERQP